MEGVALKELNLERHDLISYLEDDTIFSILEPMPNLYFTRDPFASVQNGVILNRMYSVMLEIEKLFMQIMYLNIIRIDKGKVTVFYDRSYPFHIEGGEMLNIK